MSTPLPVIAGDAKTPADTAEQGETEQVWREGDVKPVEVPMYVWPVQGELERTHSTDKLAYDVTMRDWRTHEGIDIEAAIGSTVSASHAGSVESVVDDDFYGTVVTVNHGDGSCTVYANLAELRQSVSATGWSRAMSSALSARPRCANPVRVRTCTLRSTSTAAASIR